MRRVVKEAMIIGLAIIALVYLMMPSLLPDFLPGIGWLDEGFATLVLANTLRYYNLDLTSLYKKEPKVKYVPQQVAYTEQSVQAAAPAQEYEIYEEQDAEGVVQYVTRQK